MILDVYITETTNGGDAVLLGRDVMTVSGWESMVFLALFGGNPEQSTSERNEGEQSFDWWGNSLLFPDNPDRQFNSFTERALKEVALTSSGRLQIQQAVETDLEFMRAFAEVTVETAIVETDRIEIRISVRKPDQLQEQVYIYLWDGLTGSLAITSPSNLGDFNSDFNNDFNS